jgi:hypothetical protein
MGAEPRHINYGLKFQARSLVATHPEHGRSRWLVGTNALRDENEVPAPPHFLNYFRTMTPCL